MRHRSARPRPSRRAISPVLVPGGRRRSRIPIPAAIALVSALLAGLAVVLAPSAPQAGAQAAASTQDATDGQSAQAVIDWPLGGEWSSWPWTSATFEGSDAHLPNPCGRTHAFRNVRKVGVNRYTGEIGVLFQGSCPSETLTWEPVDLTISPSGNEMLAQTSSSASTYIRRVPVPSDPMQLLEVWWLMPGDGSGAGDSPVGGDTSGLFGPDGELLRPDDFPPLDPVAVTGRALEANPSALESCMAGASDYIASIREQGVDLVKQLLRTELQLLAAEDAVGPAVADVVAFLKNPFDYQSAAADPARWLCGQLVGLAADLGIGKLARGVTRSVDELASDLVERHPNVRIDDDLVADPNMLEAMAARCVSNSFTADTRVLLADGTTRPIDEVTVGTDVLAADPVTALPAARPVTDLVTGSGPKELVDLTVDGTRVTATAGHPFWRPDVDRWTDAGDLRVGDTVQSVAGDAPVQAVRYRTQETTVFNLTVGGLHTYFVMAGDVPVLVHNAGCTVADRIAAVRANPLLIDEADRLSRIEREAVAGQASSAGELAAIERNLAAGRTVRILPEVENSFVRVDGKDVSRKNPDLDIDGQLVEVKTPRKLGPDTLQRRLAHANDQIRHSGLPNNTGGSLEFQLFGPTAAEIPAAEIARQIIGTGEVPGAFTATTNLAISRVTVVRDGAVAQEWVRQPGGAVVQTVGADR